MKYTYEQVSKFSQDLSSKTPGSNEFTKRQYKNWDEFEALLKDNGDLQSAAFTTKGALSTYVMVIAQAWKFLDEQKPSFWNPNFIRDRRYKFLEDKVDRSIIFLKALHAAGRPFSHPDWYTGVIAPSESASKASPAKPVQQPAASSSVSDHAVTQFVQSKPFQDLENYLKTVLDHDTRRHSYDLKCAKYDMTVTKSPTLKAFIEDLKKATDMSKVRQIMKTFYEGKGSEKGDTPYDILNKGQNITTRMFSFFGMRTTTISLIDDLKHSIDPQTTPVHNV